MKSKQEIKQCSPHETGGRYEIIINQTRYLQNTVDKIELCAIQFHIHIFNHVNESNWLRKASK